MTRRRNVVLAAAFFTVIGVGAALLTCLRGDNRVPAVQEREGRRSVSFEKRKIHHPKTQADQATRTPIPSPRSGYGLVTCDLDIDLAGTLTGNLKRQDQYDGEAILSDGKLVVQVPAGSGAARFEFEVAQGSFTWEDLADGGSGTCSGQR